MCASKRRTLRATIVTTLSHMTSDVSVFVKCDTIFRLFFCKFCKLTQKLIHNLSFLIPLPGPTSLNNFTNFIHVFLNNPVHKQTDKQTNQDKDITFMTEIINQNNTVLQRYGNDAVIIEKQRLNVFMIRSLQLQ